MDSALAAGQPSSAAYRPSAMVRALAILIAVTIATRFGEFGNPLTHVDDQFYLFTGQAMLHGELPYIDVWDRKPIGLFLIYAAIAALGGDSVLLYHLVAGVSTFATGVVILLLGKRLGGMRGGLAAAVLYLILLPTIGGVGGQSPVFYNLLIAGAALLTFDALRPRADRRRLALMAMALCGLAIQVKPTSLFEGAFFGIALLLAEWRERRTLEAPARLALPMLLVALAPTLAAFGSYALLGHAGEMWSATVMSNFHRGSLPWSDRMADIPQILLFLGVPLILAASTLIGRFRCLGADDTNLFLAGWAAAALLGYLSVPNFFNHYALPLLVPLSLILVPLFEDKRDGVLALAMVAAIPAVTLAAVPKTPGEARKGFDAVATEVAANLHGGCLYVHLGPTALYNATGACHLSPFVFPDHLELEVEAPGLPVSAEREVERIFNRRPTVVITEPRLYLTRNPKTAAIVDRRLACDYLLTRQFPTIAGRKLSMWTLRSNSRGVCPARSVEWAKN